MFIGKECFEVSKPSEKEINNKLKNTYELKYKCKEKLTLERAQKTVEFFHDRAKTQIEKMNGEYFGEEQHKRAEIGAYSIRAIEYNPTRKRLGSFSFHNGKTNIEVSNMNQEQLERTTQHETNHFLSFNQEKKELIDDKNKECKCHRISGVHELNYVQVNGEINQYVDLNRGFNEGITQMYTNRQLEQIAHYKGELSARQNGYQHATRLVEQIEQIVGKEIIAKAYYGGDLVQLKRSIDYLGGKGSFERLSKDIDEVTYSTNFSERIEAMRDAQGILVRMNEGEKL